MKLSNLVEAVTPLKISGLDNAWPEIGSIHYRAQNVQPDGLFVAIQGLAADGHDFIEEALARGALAIITQKPVNKKAIIIEVENTRKALAAVSSRFYSHPSQHMTIIGITGTNGKTTTAFLIERILQCAGANVGVIGTLNYRFSDKTFNSPMTTPESSDLQRILADMHSDGITHVVMEVTSHALDLNRIDNCQFDVGVFTNLTQDHLDYHKDMESYWSCKKKLFTEFLGSVPGESRIAAVINDKDKKGRELLKMLPEAAGDLRLISVGDSDDSNIRPQNIQQDLNGVKGRIATPAGAFEFKSLLVGRHNLENILCATGIGIALDLPLDSIKAGLETLAVVPGRLEYIPNDIKRFVYVDYAHTPDALASVLAALKELAGGKLICVFGCGGDRDRAKRPQMGKIAGEFCDLAIITSDNPRTEPPLEIIIQILEGVKLATRHEYTPQELATGLQPKGYVIEPDRRAAIRLALLVSSPGDTVLIAGKGNEDYQIIGDKTISFDDREEARAAIGALTRVSHANYQNKGVSP